MSLGSRHLGVFSAVAPNLHLPGIRRVEDYCNKRPRPACPQFARPLEGHGVVRDYRDTEDCAYAIPQRCRPDAIPPDVIGVPGVCDVEESGHGRASC